MTEEYLVRCCAPTLAGLKTGSTFVCPYESPAALRDFLRSANKKLGPKGLRLLPLRISDSRALCYLYRPGRLTKDLDQEEAAALLESQGYTLTSCAGCLAQLIRRIRSGEEFPHEIGLFLGYPPEDVRGFMENEACNHKCVGCWKVYGDEAAAKKRFDQYKKCTRVYREQWEKGCPIERLTVAS